MSRRALLLLITAFLLVSFTNVWNIPFVETSDARYSDIAFEMLHNREYMYPTMYGKAHLDKPPMTYWLSALSMKVFGINEWACRLPQTIFNFLFLLASYFFYRSFFNSRISYRIVLSLMLSVMLFAASHVLTTDFSLFFCEIIALYCFALIYIRGVSSRKLEFLFWFSLGFSFFIKGPLGFIIVIPICIIYVVLDRNWKRIFRLRHVVYLIISVILGASWYIYLLSTDMRLFKYFVYDQFLHRLSDKTVFHIEPWYFFIKIFLAGIVPWCFFLFCPERPDVNEQQKKLKKLLLLITIFPLLFFSVPASKLPFYIILSFGGFIPIAIGYREFSPRVFHVVAVIMLVILTSALLNISRFKLRTSKHFSEKILQSAVSKTPEIFIYQVKAHCCWLYTGIKPIAVDLPEEIFSLEKDDGLSKEDILKSWNSGRETFIVASARSDDFMEFKEFLIYADRHYRLFWNKADR